MTYAVEITDAAFEAIRAHARYIAIDCQAPLICGLDRLGSKLNDHDLRSELDQTVALFHATRHSAAAEPKYGVLQDAIFWEDELPGEAQFDALHFLTHIFRFRLAAARVKWQITDQTWDYFRQQVPNWPGFQSERCGDRVIRRTAAEILPELLGV